MHSRPRSIPPTPESRAWLGESREIVIPYDPVAGPLTAIRNVIIQASLTELKAHGYYERYSKLIAQRSLDRLLEASLTPGWIPVDLASEHYEACDNMMLSRAEFAVQGHRVGERVQGAALVSSAKNVREATFDLWTAVGQLHRMWPRLFQGGSVQVVKVGPKEQLIEERGFVLNRHQYYRHAHLAAVTATHVALGARVRSTKLVSYSGTRDELILRMSWD